LYRGVYPCGVEKTVILISMEIPAVVTKKDHLPYCGGISAVADGMLTSAYKHPKIEIKGFSILWSEGYYSQFLGENGMEVRYTRNYFSNILDKVGEVKIRLGENKNVVLEILKLDSEISKMSEVYYLNADIDKNDFLSRQNTRRMYQGEEHTRICQEIILGKGTIEALKELDIKHTLLHLNESNCHAAGIARLAEKIKRVGFKKALNETKKGIVFTTHTPIKGGNLTYKIDNLFAMGALDGLAEQEVYYLSKDYTFYNCTRVCMNIAGKINAVSPEHRETTKKLYNLSNSEIEYVTNGLSKKWQHADFFGNNIDKLAQAKKEHKRLFFRALEKQTGKKWNEDIPILAQARRFMANGYKRSGLLLKEENWIFDLMDSDKIQVLFAGKPYPTDIDSINLWNYIWRKSKEIKNLAILPGYDLYLMSKLHRASDIWENTPKPDKEACGDWGIGSMLNFSAYMSTETGWPRSFLVNEKNGFVIRTARPNDDCKDFKNLQKTLKRAVYLYFNEPEKFNLIRLKGKKLAEDCLSANRMLNEYIKKMY